MQLNKLRSVKTVDRLHDLAIAMEPEDGIIWVYGTADVAVLAFTPFGVKNLAEIIAIERDRKP